jgi:hypothetical protein
VGDTTKVTSRPQALTREIDTSVVISGALVAAVEREAADAGMLAVLTSRAARTRCAGATR